MLTVPSSGLCFTVDIADVDEQDVAHGVRSSWQKDNPYVSLFTNLLPFPLRDHQLHSYPYKVLK